jgi:hypothetical protein
MNPIHFKGFLMKWVTELDPCFSIVFGALKKSMLRKIV